MAGFPEKEKWVVCDIDGVLADPEHRLHFIEGGKKDWDGFFAAAKDDEPRPVEIEILRLFATSPLADYGICLLTGRSDQIEEVTVEWLIRHNVPFDLLYMREEGDYRPDTQVKPELMMRFLKDEEIMPSDVLVVFEDRRSVVDQWRDAGFVCLQNASGEF